MKKKAFAVSLIIALSAITAAQQDSQHIDPTIVSPDNYSVLLENEHVRVVEYQILPGEKDAWHTHPPKVSYIVSGGTLRITPQGEEPFVVEENSGNATWMGALGPHFGENIGTTPVRITLVEIKSLADSPFEAIERSD